MIEIKNLEKKYGKKIILNNLNITFLKGESVSIIGPNGCGKTTLIKSILGIVVPEKGTIKVNGENIKNDHLYRKNIGYMPQIGRYPENMTVYQIIDIIKKLRKFEDKIDNEIYEKFDIEGILNKKMSALSGGTVQKVSACIAFMFNPQIIILDEPTAGLDLLSSEILKEKIIKEKKNGKLIIITSHILSELEDLITEVLYIQEGKIKFHKNIENIKAITNEKTISKAITNIIKNKIDV